MRKGMSIVILVVAGLLFVGLAATAMFTGHDVLSGGFGVLGLLAFALAALAPRMRGDVEASLQGFKFALVEEIVDRGEREGNSLDVIVAAVRKAIESPVPPDEEPTEAPEATSPHGHRPAPVRPGSPLRGGGANTEQLVDQLYADAVGAVRSRAT